MEERNTQGQESQARGAGGGGSSIRQGVRGSLMEKVTRPDMGGRRYLREEWRSQSVPVAKALKSEACLPVWAGAE